MRLIKIAAAVGIAAVCLMMPKQSRAQWVPSPMTFHQMSGGTSGGGWFAVSSGGSTGTEIVGSRGAGSASGVWEFSRLYTWTGVGPSPVLTVIETDTINGSGSPTDICMGSDNWGSWSYARLGNPFTEVNGGTFMSIAGAPTATPTVTIGNSYRSSGGTGQVEADLSFTP